MTRLLPQLTLVCLFCMAVPAQPADLSQLAGRPADIAASAYQYRADRAPRENPPESWIAVMKYAGQPLNKPLDIKAPAVRKALCGLLWEEVRRVRRVELVWPADARRRPAADQVAVSFLDAQSTKIPTWWNSTTLREAGPPEISADGRTYAYAVPVDIFGLLVSVHGPSDAGAYAVPVVRAMAPDLWKKIDLEIEWGFDGAIAGGEGDSPIFGRTLRVADLKSGQSPAAGLDYSGRIEAYDGILGHLDPLSDDTNTVISGPQQWQSATGNGRRGVRLSLLYRGTSPNRKVWPYNAAAEDVARTIVTVWSRAGNFSFLASDLERGPIYAPEYGFYVRATSRPHSTTAAAWQFVKRWRAAHGPTIRQQARQHPEQTWEGAMAAMFPGKTLPPIPKPEYEPAMKVEVPCPRLTAQWNLGAWHLIRHCQKTVQGQLRFNDYPYGILAAETYLIFRTLDLMGMHRQVADGLDQWLGLPVRNNPPVGLFADGEGCLTGATGPAGAGGNMDSIHGMGPGAIMLALVEHFRLTGDRQWLKANAPRMKANVEWILRQRRVLAHAIPGGARLWCKGLQPPQQVTPDSGGQLMQFYEAEAYYWLAVASFAQALREIEPTEPKGTVPFSGGRVASASENRDSPPAEATRLAAEAEAYGKDLRAAVERSIALSPVVQVRDGSYRSFIPFACYVRGFASGAWSWRRPGSGEHVGGLYWDTIQNAEPLVSPAGLLPPQDRRVQGTLDVLEDRLLLENPKLAMRTPNYDPEKDWFAHAAWQYQPGLERHANIHLAADDPANFLRSWLNQYAVLILPWDGYVFREHTVTGPPDKIFEEAAFLERFRQMLVMEDGERLWLARATPRVWLEHGKKIVVTNAPTQFGTVAYQIRSAAGEGKITATVTMPSRGGQKAVLLRLRHPRAAPIKRITVNGRPWRQFDKQHETIRLDGVEGDVAVEAYY
jgi:hypothetical protein